MLYSAVYSYNARPRAIPPQHGQWSQHGPMEGTLIERILLTSILIYLTREMLEGISVSECKCNVYLSLLFVGSEFR